MCNSEIRVQTQTSARNRACFHNKPISADLDIEHLYRIIRRMASQQTDNTETWNPWRTVAMESFVDHWQRAPSTEQSSSNVQDAFEQVLAPELEDPARSPLEEDGDDDEDWVVVEKPMVEKSHWTRTMTDTEFNRVFQQPLPHNYGRANTQPSAEENYLKTFNVKVGLVVFKDMLRRGVI